MRGLGPSGASRALVLVDGLAPERSLRGLDLLGPRPRREHRSRRGAPRRRFRPLRKRRPRWGHPGADPARGRAARTCRWRRAWATKARPKARCPRAGASGNGGPGSRPERSRPTATSWSTKRSAAPVDTEAAARYATGDLTVDRTIPGGRAFVRGRFFGESRKNGTPLQTNDTRVNQVALGADTSGPRFGQASVRFYASDSGLQSDVHGGGRRPRQRGPDP